MSRARSNFYNKKEHRAIYILVSPTEKSFHINHCLVESVRETYRHNIKGRRYATQKFISDIQPDRPCLFVLEEIETTISDAYKHVLVWIKILMENGYKCYNYKATIDATKELHAKTEKLYMDRKDTDLTELLCCENCLVKVYNRIECKNLKQNNI